MGIPSRGRDIVGTDTEVLEVGVGALVNVLSMPVTLGVGVGVGNPNVPIGRLATILAVESVTKQNKNCEGDSIRSWDRSSRESNTSDEGDDGSESSGTHDGLAEGKSLELKCVVKVVKCTSATT